MHSASTTNLCPPCTPSCVDSVSVRAMRAHDFPCGTVRASSAYTTLRIKSPQLYRLSYQPKLLDTCGIQSTASSAVARIVSPVYPSAIAAGRGSR